MAASQFKYLFTPIDIGPVTVRNRIVFGAHGTGLRFYEDDDRGYQYVEYQRARAKGGCGLIVLGAVSVHKSSETPLQPFPRDRKRLVEKYRALADAVHEHGAKVVQQIFHFGMRTNGGSTNASGIWSFSGGPAILGALDQTHQMTRREIEEVIDGFVRLAVDCRAGGLDGVELHATHGSLIQQSWSPWGNQRRDEYGEPMTFALRITDRVRAAVGKDFVVGIRISSDDWMPNGLGIDAMQRIAQTVERTVKIDYISLCSGALPRHYAISIGAMHLPPAVCMPQHAQIREVVEEIPIVAGGKVNDPVLAEKLLADGQTDLVWMVRPLICDPELPIKAQRGRVDDIRTCIACNQGCIDRRHAGLEVRCLQNAAAGREHAVVALGMATEKKKVMVVGGGPGGLEAARVAAMRGHEVLLVEKSAQLGGQINLITQIPGRHDFEQAIRWLTVQVAREGVKIETGVAVTPRLVETERPDAVILAAGSLPYEPNIQGVDQSHVVTTWDVLEHPVQAGENVAVVDHLANYESSYLVDHLLDLGAKVTLITPFYHAAFKVGYSNSIPLQERFHKKGLVVVPNSSLKAISGRSITITNSFSGAEREVADLDRVLLITGNKANDSLYEALEGTVKELYTIGDCVAHRSVLQAIQEGFDVAMAL